MPERVTRVVHLTSAHAPNDTRIYQKECLSLHEAGFDVTLVAPGDCDSEGEVRLIAVPKPAQRWRRMLGATSRMYRAARQAGGDLYHFHDPELIPVGLALRLSGKRVVYDVHEDLPRAILSKYYLPKAARTAVAGLAEVMEFLGARAFSGLVAATPTIGKRFPARKTAVVQNFPLVDELVTPAENVPPKREPLFAYVGALTRIRGGDQMLEALCQVEDARLAIAGTFSPKAYEQELASNPAWKRVEFLGQQDRTQVAALLGRARAGLVLFHPEPNHVNAQPNKLFEYMSASLPVIASDFPLWREIVGDANCGLLVDPMSPRRIGEAMQWILDHPEEAEAMGRRGREAVVERFNWDAEKRKLIEFYKRLGVSE